jgi:hypothetical protein
MIIIFHVPNNLASNVTTSSVSLFTGAKFFLDTAGESNLLVLQGTSTPRSMITEISYDTALSQIPERASVNIFCFRTGISMKKAAGTAIEFKKQCVPRRKKTKQKTKHPPPEWGIKTFRSMVSMGIKQKVTDRDNAPPSEFDLDESENPPCKMPRENPTYKVSRHDI